MTKSEAARLISEHLDRYLESLECDPTTQLRSYATENSGTECPLCEAAIHCCSCIDWPLSSETKWCLYFVGSVNHLPTPTAKREAIAALRVALAEWEKG